MDKNKDITSVVDNYLCHSCGACFAACAHDSISFYHTVGGYNFPKIDYSKCTNCGLCYKVCSGTHFGNSLSNKTPRDPFVGNIISCEVGIAIDDKIYCNSQSGGVVTALLAYLLDTNQIEFALVAAMDASNPLIGDFVIIKNSTELHDTQKSKYLPISLLKALPRFKTVEKPIAIVGLPCHMHSLQNFCDLHLWLRKREILKIGLICDRILLETSVDFITKQATDTKVIKFDFRNKEKFSYPGNPYLVTQDNQEFVLNKSVRMDMKDFFTPVRCRLCFDKLNIYSDITCGDPHGLDNIDRQNGETLVMARTQKGFDTIRNAIKDVRIQLRPANREEAVKGQRIDDNKHSWSTYMSAWKQMGNVVPKYPFEFISKRNCTKEIRFFQHALSLNKKKSKNDVLHLANKNYMRIKLKKKLLFPSRVIKLILRKIKQEVIK